MQHLIYERHFGLKIMYQKHLNKKNTQFSKVEKLFAIYENYLFTPDYA